MRAGGGRTQTRCTYAFATLTNVLIARVVLTMPVSAATKAGLWTGQRQESRNIRVAHSSRATLVHALMKPNAPAVTEHIESTPKTSHDFVKIFTRHMKYCCTETEMLSSLSTT